MFLQHCPQSKVHNFSCIGFSDPAELPIGGVVVDDFSLVPGALEIGPVFSSVELFTESIDSIEVLEFHLSRVFCIPHHRLCRRGVCKEMSRRLDT